MGAKKKGLILALLNPFLGAALFLLFQTSPVFAWTNNANVGDRIYAVDINEIVDLINARGAECASPPSGLPLAHVNSGQSALSTTLTLLRQKTNEVYACKGIATLGGNSVWSAPNTHAVKAANSALLSLEIQDLRAAISNAALAGPTCNNNGSMDNGETGVDCGGGGCPSCVTCNNNGSMDNGESGIDCGGGGCAACCPCTDQGLWCQGTNYFNGCGASCTGTGIPFPDISCPSSCSLNHYYSGGNCISNVPAVGPACSYSSDVACPAQCDDTLGCVECLDDGDCYPNYCGNPLTCQSGVCANFWTINGMPCPDPWGCNDGIKDYLEEGVDCGGPKCSACDACSNGIQDGDETDVDCGGSVCPECTTPGACCGHEGEINLCGDGDPCTNNHICLAGCGCSAGDPVCDPPNGCFAGCVCPPECLYGCLPDNVTCIPFCGDGTCDPEGECCQDCGCPSSPPPNGYWYCHVDGNCYGGCNFVDCAGACCSAGEVCLPDLTCGACVPTTGTECGTDDCGVTHPNTCAGIAVCVNGYCSVPGCSGSGDDFNSCTTDICISGFWYNIPITCGPCEVCLPVTGCQGYCGGLTCGADGASCCDPYDVACLSGVGT